MLRLIFALLLLLNQLVAIEEGEEELYRFRFRVPRKAVVEVGTPLTSDKPDHGHRSLTEAEIEKHGKKVMDFLTERRKQGGPLTKEDVVRLYHEATDFKVIHGLLGEDIGEVESKQIGRLRQEIHEEVLQRLADSGEFGKRMGVNDFGSGADPASVDAKTDIDFTGYPDDMRITGDRMVARYNQEFREVCKKYGFAVDPGQMDIVAHRYEATIPDWRQNRSLADFEVRLRTGLSLLRQNPEAYFLEGAYMQQVMKRSAAPGAKTFAWYEHDENGKLTKRMVPATEVSQFFFRPDIRARYAWGAAVGNWHFFNAHSDDKAAQAKYILRSIDDGPGLLLGNKKPGSYEKLSDSQRAEVVRQLYGRNLPKQTVDYIRTVLDTAAHIRTLKSNKTLSMGSVQGRLKAYAPLIERERQLAGGMQMTDEELLRFAEDSFQRYGKKLLMQNNLLASRGRLTDWLAPPLKPGQRMSYLDKNGNPKVRDVDAGLIKRLQYSAFFELKDAISLMDEAQVKRLQDANPRYRSDIEILKGVVRKQKEMMNAPEHLKPKEAAQHRRNVADDILDDYSRLQGVFKNKGYASGVWNSAQTAWQRGQQVEDWMKRASIDLVASVGGKHFVAQLDRLRAGVDSTNQRLIGPKWMARLDRGTSVIEVLKAYMREGEVNEAVLKVALYEGLSYVPGVSILYTLQGPAHGVSTLTLVTLVPGYGQMLLVLNFAKGSVELAGLAIFEPLKRDKILLAYQGYLDPEEGGLITSGQKERVESPRPAVLYPVDPDRKLSLDERREKMYAFLHAKVLERMKQDASIWYTEEEMPVDWREKEFEHLGPVVDQYIEEWWTGTGYFSSFDVLTVHRGPNVKPELIQLLRKDYVTGKNLAIQREMQEQEALRAQMFGQFERVAGYDIAMDEEGRRQRGTYELAGELTQAAALYEIEPTKPHIEILMAPSVRKLENEDEETLLTERLGLRARVTASEEEHPSPYRVEWSVLGAGAEPMNFTDFTREEVEANRGQVTIVATAYDAEGNRMVEARLPVEVERVKIGEKEEEDEDSEGGEDTAGEDPAVENEMTTLVAEVSGAALQADVDCRTGRDQAQAAGDRMQDFESSMAEVQQKLDQLTQRAAELQVRMSQADDWVAKIENNGRRFAELRDEVGRAALAACEATQTLKNTHSSEGRQRIFAEVQAKRKLAAERYREAQRLRKESHEALDRLQELSRLLREFQKESRELRNELEDPAQLAAEAEASLGQVETTQVQTSLNNERLEELRNRALAAAGDSTSEQAQVDLAQITALQQSVEQCPGELEQLLSEGRQRWDSLSNEWSSLQSRLDQSLIQDQDVQRLEANVRDSKATVDAMDLYIETMASRVEEAALCEVLAEELLEEGVEYLVPDVVGMSLPSATGLIKDAGLDVSRAAGSPAPDRDLAYHVEETDPAAGTKLEEKQAVVLKVYGPYQETLPDLRGMTLDQARSALKPFGVSVAARAGDKAPSESMAFTIQDHNPGPGMPAPKEGAVVVRLYGKAQAIEEEPEQEPPVEEPVVEEEPPMEPPPVTPEVTEEPPAGEEFGEPFYIIMTVWMPQIPEKLPKDMKASTWLAQQSVSSLRWKPADKPAYAVVRDAGQQYYSKEMFQPGSMLATPLTISASNVGMNVSGAMLVKVGAVYTDAAAFNRVVGSPQAAKEGGLLFFDLNRSDGRFDLSASNQEVTFRYSGGPFEQGWSGTRKADAKRLTTGILQAMGCFVATEVYRDWTLPQLQVLRAFRDDVLLSSRGGQDLVNYYYRQGPRVAQWVHDHPWTRPYLRGALNLVVWTLERWQPSADGLDPVLRATSALLGEADPIEYEIDLGECRIKEATR